MQCIEIWCSVSVMHDGTAHYQTNERAWYVCPSQRFWLKQGAGDERRLPPSQSVRMWHGSGELNRFVTRATSLFIVERHKRKLNCQSMYMYGNIWRGANPLPQISIGFSSLDDSTCTAYCLPGKFDRGLHLCIWRLQSFLQYPMRMRTTTRNQRLSAWPESKEKKHE